MLAGLVKPHGMGRVQGELPLVDLFKIDWSDAWYESNADDKYKFRDEAEKPSFKEVFEEQITKHKLDELRQDLKVVDCNLRTVDALDQHGIVVEDIAGKYIPRKADRGYVCRDSFPLFFQKAAEGGNTLGVRPSNLKFRDDDTVDKLRFRKVEMSVGPTHNKPDLDGEFGQLGIFQAPAQKWAVRPDRRDLWDRREDNVPCPVLMCSTELSDCSSFRV